MSFYSESAYPVAADLAAVHEAQFTALGKPGSWGTGAQRLAIAVRHLSPHQDLLTQGRLGVPLDHAEIRVCVRLLGDRMKGALYLARSGGNGRSGEARRQPGGPCREAQVSGQRAACQPFGAGPRRTGAL